MAEALHIALPGINACRYNQNLRVAHTGVQTIHLIMIKTTIPETDEERAEGLLLLHIYYKLKELMGY